MSYKLQHMKNISLDYLSLYFLPVDAVFRNLA
jgi:hypothetical protein